jgi:hypothetical protein
VSDYPPWKYYPTWQPRPQWVHHVVGVIAGNRIDLDSTHFIGEDLHQRSPVVQAKLKQLLEPLGFVIEDPAARGLVPQLRRAVLHGEGAAMERYYDVDGWHETEGIALEIEGGKAHEGRNAVWDLIKFSLISDVRYGCILVPVHYEPRQRSWSPPYERIRGDFDAMYANPDRFRIPLEGLLLVGY